MTGRNPARFRVYGFCGTALAAVALWASIQCESPVATSAWASLACLATLSQQATFWAITTEIGGIHLGAVFGLINSMGVPGGYLSSKFFGQFADWMGSRGYEGCGAMGSGVLLVRATARDRRGAAGCWLTRRRRFRMGECADW